VFPYPLLVLTFEVPDSGLVLDVMADFVTEGLPHLVEPTVTVLPAEVDERPVVEDDESPEDVVAMVLAEDKEAGSVVGTLGRGVGQDTAVKTVKQALWNLVEHVAQP